MSDIFSLTKKECVSNSQIHNHKDEALSHLYHICSVSRKNIFFFYLGSAGQASGPLPRGVRHLWKIWFLLRVFHVLILSNLTTAVPETQYQLVNRSHTPCRQRCIELNRYWFSLLARVSFDADIKYSWLCPDVQLLLHPYCTGLKLADLSYNLDCFV